MNNHHISNHNVGLEIITNDLDNSSQYQPELISYESMRQPLWDIHEFVRQVLAKDSPGFRISVKKNGDKIIEPLALGERFYRRINNFIARILPPCQAAGFVGLFFDCCVELQLFRNPFGKAGAYHRPGMNGAELFNALLELIRKRAPKDRRCKKFLNFSEDYDLVQLQSMVRYVNALFRICPKLLVVRVDLGYASDEAEKITFERARSDIKRFVNYRDWHAFFKHCIGFVIGRERGTGSDKENGGNGRGFHFHCYLFFNGQREKKDIELADKVLDYWKNRIVNNPRTEAMDYIEPWAWNCNQKGDGYKFNGIGMISHSDELKRWNSLCSMIYLSKKSQPLGDEAPPRSKTMTKGELPPLKEEYRGRRRQLIVDGEKVAVPRRALYVGQFLQPGDMV